VFGYGSLIWQPGFVYAEDAWGLLRGYHRALSILSVVNRGSRDKPGLALGLERGGSCRGRVLRVAAADAAEVRAYLWRREMPHQAYVDRLLPVRLDNGRRVRALTFISRPGHPQHAPGLPLEEAAAMIAHACGSYGSSLDYLRCVVAQLDRFGLKEGTLHRLLARAEAIAAKPATPSPAAPPAEPR
jgi:cation transport protein ChaC